MQAYLPGAGWVDFDPTNDIVGNRNLIRVAVAWDQRNALPLWGTFVGPPSCVHGMDVSVSVSEGLSMLLSYLAGQCMPHCQDLRSNASAPNDSRLRTS